MMVLAIQQNISVYDGGLGQVKLFHYGSEKFITTSAGVKVTGEVNLIW